MTSFLYNFKTEFTPVGEVPNPNDIVNMQRGRSSYQDAPYSADKVATDR